MDGELLAELRELRLRAYGPAADIGQDPEAVRRLQELESLVAAKVPRDGGGDAEVVEVPASTDEGEAAGDEREPSGGSSPGGDPPSKPAAWRRHPWLLPSAWLASLVTVGVGAAVATLVWAIAVYAPISRGPEDAIQVAVLRVDPGFEGPGFFGDTASATGYQELYGLTVVATRMGFYGAGSEDCLMVFPTNNYVQGSDSMSGPIYSACGAGPFPASVIVPLSDSSSEDVVEQLPQALREHFAEYSALQFVHDGDRIGVFAGTAN